VGSLDKRKDEARVFGKLQGFLYVCKMKSM
jgi:hypothetical protein